MQVSSLSEVGSALRFDPADPAFVSNPYPIYKRLRDERPAFYLEAHQLWLITRYDDVFKALTTPSLWSSSKGNVVVDSAVRVGRTLGTLDPPRHDELRKIISKGVSPARVRLLSTQARAYTNEAIKKIVLEKEFDVIGSFARPILNRSLASLVGLDERYADEVDRLIEAALDTSNAPIGPVGTPAAGAALFAFLMDRIEERSEPLPTDTDDFLSVLIAARDSGAPLSNEEIAANMMTVLLAGSASVVHFFGNLLNTLYLHPDTRSSLLERPALLDSIIEETVRWDTSTQCFARQLTQDIKISDTTIPAGHRALLILGSANRDERAIERPDDFLPERKRTRHLGFGAGPHQCLGSMAAWQLCRVILEEALPLLGNYELDLPNAQRVRFIMFRGFKSLPCVAARTL